MENTLEVTENKLEIMVKESGLEQTKAQYILDKFKDAFEFASKWEKQAKTIVVTDAKQTAEMEMARIGRLELRKRRIEIENSRKELKEQALREGKAIDGIANVLKALIVPVEEYLEQQEKFVEIKEEKEREAKRIEIEKRIEEEQLAKEKAEAEERERIKIENERLKKEAEEREKKYREEQARAEAEKRKQEEAMQKERQEAERKRLEAEAKAKAEKEKIKKEAEAKLSKERKIAEDKFKAEQKSVHAEVERVRKLNEEKLAKERVEKERLEAKLKNQIECPHCHKKFQIKR